MCVLTIAVPIFNMEWCLEKNLKTYADERLAGRVDVICLNNASEDGSKAIIERAVAQWPSIFRMFDRDSRGYGSSINEALAAAIVSGASGAELSIAYVDDGGLQAAPAWITDREGEGA